MSGPLSPDARLAFLAEASHTLSSSLDYETTLRAVARLAVPTLADWCAVDLADGSGRLVRLAVTHVDPERERWGREIHRRYPPDPDEALGIHQVFRTGKPVLWPELSEELLVQLARDAEHLRLLRDLGLSSVLIVPVASRDRLLGTLTLVHGESGRRFDSADLALAKALGDRAGLAVENARLFHAEQLGRARAEALLALSSALAHDLTAVDVAATSLEHALPALGASAGAFLVPSAGGMGLDLLHHVGYPLEAVEPWRIVPFDAAVPVADAFRSGRPVYLETIEQRGARYPATLEARETTGSVAIAALPLLSQDRAVGVLALSFAGERAFGAEDSGFMQTLAGHCAQALDRALARGALHDSEARFRSVVESGMMGIAFWNGERVADANDTLLQILGYERDDVAAGVIRHGALTPAEYEPADARAYAECLVRRSCTPYEKEFFRKDGSRVPVLVGGSLLGSDTRRGVFFVLDLTARRQAEADVQAAQRLEAVGRLAGGVAHEINNALQGVLGFTAFVRRATAPADPRSADLTEIEKAAVRAADITQQLLAFGRRQIRRPVDLDLGQVVTEFVPMLQQALGPKRTLLIDPADGALRVHADRGQLEQVLLNLTLNARDAMPDGGRLTLAFERVEVGPATVPAEEQIEPPAPGHYVRLVVRDTGIGMDRATRERIFEPFFTTKPTGQGSGLGLSVVYGIVRQNGGFITVVSAPSAGATFGIHLPAAQGPATLSDPAAPAAAPGGSETVLVVDDEPSVLTIASRELAGAGYRVLTAAAGEDALRVVERTPELALVVTDIVMPGLGGYELARRLAEHRPGLRILLTSGQPDDVGQMLAKPFSPETLLRAVRTALDGAG